MNIRDGKTNAIYIGKLWFVQAHDKDAKIIWITDMLGHKKKKYQS